LDVKALAKPTAADTYQICALSFLACGDRKNIFVPSSRIENRSAEQKLRADMVMPEREGRPTASRLF
jgi:hypothetical protein